MRFDLLLKAADILEADAANPEGVQFDLKEWAKKADEHIRYDTGGSFKEGEIIPINCSTAACAVGLFALTGAFKGEGLSYHITARGLLIPIFRKGDVNEDGYDAAESLFELGRRPTGLRDAYYLFDPDYYGGDAPKKGAEAELMVAKRIRDFVAEHGG